MQFHITLSVLFISVVFGHIELESPGPFRGRFNNNTKNVDFDSTNPLTGASQFPCKGYHIAAMADPTGEGKPTAIWMQGAAAFLKLSKGGLHSGGSCQASLSYDLGKTFTVIYSMQGDCPTSDMAFTIPADAPLGMAIGSWSWLNKSGNREFYQNCFAVSIEASTGGTPPAIAFSQRPAILVANLGTSCKSVEGADVRFLNPGPDVTGQGDANSLTGDCGTTTPGSSPAAPAPKQPLPGPAPGGPANSDLVSVTNVPTRSVPSRSHPSPHFNQPHLRSPPSRFQRTFRSLPAHPSSPLSLQQLPSSPFLSSQEAHLGSLLR